MLWFVAENEAVAVKALRMYIREEKLTQGVLYQEIVGKGEVKRLRINVADLCEAYGIALTPEREAWIQSAEIRQLDELRAHLERERAWPDALPA